MIQLTNQGVQRGVTLADMTDEQRRAVAKWSRNAAAQHFWYGQAAAQHGDVLAVAGHQRTHLGALAQAEAIESAYL